MKRMVLAALVSVLGLVSLQSCGGSTPSPRSSITSTEAVVPDTLAAATGTVDVASTARPILERVSDTYVASHPYADRQMVVLRLRALAPQLQAVWGEPGYEVALNAVAIEEVLHGNGIAVDAMELLEWLNRAPWRPVIMSPYVPEMFPSCIMVLGKYARLRNQSLSDIEARRQVEQEFDILAPGEVRVVPTSVVESIDGEPSKQSEQHGSR